MDLLLVLTPGAYTTVQDNRRYGYQQVGIPLSGALDSFSFDVANMLVNNPANSAVLEITITGCRFEVLNEADAAITGAEIGITLNERPVECWRSFRIKPGDILEIKQVKSGCRAYLALTGGIDVPIVMGSRSTYVGGNIGGYLGRPLKQGDIIKRGEGLTLKRMRKLSPAMIPQYSSNIVLHAVLGPQDEFFDEGLKILFNSEFMVTPKADRMGYRLQGPAIHHRDSVQKSIISEPSVPGGIQIPADGQPIILLMEQTVGGYAKIATVISTDLCK
ncbi:MAG: biotin-dependent carboxyltransferase family protein, partial [Deltaproteobacteria bacterium]|nr:biotin-dependent carboxyltransferase family protein [Deltaproteobacteria bacterium]